MGGWGGWGAEGGREDDRTHEGDKGGRRRKGRGQCRRTEPEALKYIYIYIMYCPFKHHQKEAHFESAFPNGESQHLLNGCQNRRISKMCFSSRNHFDCKLKMGASTNVFRRTASPLLGAWRFQSPGPVAKRVGSSG